EAGMTANSKGTASARMISRRRLISGAAIAIGGFAASAKTLFARQQQQMAEAQSKGAEALLDSAQFGAFTKMPAEVRAQDGAHFSLFGGMILGRNVELAPNQRIVQAWRSASWPAGVYSIAKLEMSGGVNLTHVVLDHTGFPEGGFRHLNQGWYDHYWGPLQKYLET
ncbi:MAG TPA: SRPBCC domain-containing protein, partial [Candidatus Acidoferrales bacterium]|nr:SRPBCC domain-containing protein [Candidatus Acidoferrales bacterium]